MNNFQSVQTYQAQPETTGTAFPQSLNCDEVTRITVTNGAVTETVSNATDGGSVRELNPYHGTDSVLATARNANGTPVHEVTLTTLVTVDGVEAQVSNWVSQGRLHKTPDGTYAESAAAPGVAPVDTSDVMPLTDATMGRVNDALATVDQGSVDGLMAVSIGVALGSTDPRTMEHKWTQVSGLGGAEGAEKWATITGAYQAQADAALLTRGGIEGADLGAFYTWARSNARGELQQAIQRQLQQHDVSGYAALADRWMSATAPSVRALQAAGVPVRTQNHQPEVFIRGQWMSPSAAARAGLI